jgi:hypothetical protein
VCVKIEFLNFEIFAYTSEFGFYSVASSFLFWMVRMWTLETAAALILPSLRMETMWMGLFHHGKWTSSFGMKRTGLFSVILAHQNDFAILNATDIFFKAEKVPSY